jgi:hypothetical protein
MNGRLRQKGAFEGEFFWFEFSLASAKGVMNDTVKTEDLE